MLIQTSVFCVCRLPSIQELIVILWFESVVNNPGAQFNDLTGQSAVTFNVTNQELR